MKKYAILIIMGLVVLLSACDRETVIYPDEQQNQIRVSGSATIMTAPDMATTQIGVETFNKEIEAAIAENNRKASAVQEALKQQGIAEKDMRTVSFNIYPQRDYKDNYNEIIGYQVSNTISVTFRDLTSIGKDLQAALDAGANNVSGISFTLADIESLRDEARIKAVENAREKAESMAAAAGIIVGKVINITETSSGGVIITDYYDKAAFDNEVPIQSGELGVTVQVEVVFDIP